MGGETTTYTYDNAGQLTRVTLPDSSFLEYTYDAAHRLTQIADNQQSSNPGSDQRNALIRSKNISPDGHPGGLAARF